MKIKGAKGKILEILNKQSEGLTIQQLSKIARMSRITTTKYIHELIGEGKIRERKIGIYRILFSKERFLKSVEENKILDKLKKKLK